MQKLLNATTPQAAGMIGIQSVSPPEMTTAKTSISGRKKIATHPTTGFAIRAFQPRGGSGLSFMPSILPRRKSDSHTFPPIYCSIDSSIW